MRVWLQLCCWFTRGKPPRSSVPRFARLCYVTGSDALTFSQLPGAPERILAVCRCQTALNEEKQCDAQVGELKKRTIGLRLSSSKMVR